MQINCETIERLTTEPEIFEAALNLDHKKILELGCGDARLTRLIATMGVERTLVATEVDQIQHNKNLLINDLPNVEFKFGGGENINAIDNSFDVVLMFKSLHHVPTALMDNVLKEIKRVLKPGGLVYISEPIFKGDFNEIIRLFHDEESVRKSAFNAIKKSVNNKDFSLVNEIFFNSPTIYKTFEEFEQRIIKATHTEHSMDNELYIKVREKFDHYVKLNHGNFISPNRVDILKKV